MKPTWEQGDVQLYLGDCLEVLPTLEAGSVDAVITDPPYGVGIAGWDDFMPVSALEASLCLDCPVLWFGSGLKLAEDVPRFPEAPQRVLIWYLSFALPRRVGQGMQNRYHPIYAWNIPESQAGIRQDVIVVPQDGRRDWWFHPGTKPLTLMRRLVGIVDAETVVLDPFMGSGTTGVACVKTGRKFIGIEIDEGYFDIAVKRISEAQMQPRLEGLWCMMEGLP